jgi:hypothetical protein
MVRAERSGLVGGDAAGWGGENGEYPPQDIAAALRQHADGHEGAEAPGEHAVNQGSAEHDIRNGVGANCHSGKRLTGA